MTEQNKGKKNGGNGNGNYTAEDIKVLGGMEAVRLRPAMYIGSNGVMGLHHLVYEVLDNSIDEHLAGFCTKIEVVIHVDGSISVRDNGRGMGDARPGAFGLRLVESLAGQLGGTVTRDDVPKGTLTTLRFPYSL